MTALLVGVFVASFLGSLHCVGMCGPLVCLYAQPGEASGRWLHVAYQGGRLSTLLLLGLLAGALGTGVDALGGHVGLQQVVAVAAGVLAIVWGVAAVALGAGVEVRLPQAFNARVSALFARATALPPTRRALLIGVLTPFLPCGWLYLFVLTAAGTGHPLTAAGVMAAFWGGNLPALTGLALGLRAGLGNLRQKVPALGGLIMIVMGALLLTQRTQPLILPTLREASPQAHPTSATQTAPVSSVAVPDPDAPAPCCGGADAP